MTRQCTPVFFCFVVITAVYREERRYLSDYARTQNSEEYLEQIISRNIFTQVLVLQKSK